MKDTCSQCGSSEIAGTIINAFNSACLVRSVCAACGHEDKRGIPSRDIRNGVFGEELRYQLDNLH